jgi:hypothetical protein
MALCRSLLASIALVAAGCATGPSVHDLHVTSTPEARHVAASGEAEIKVAPDEVVFRIGVETVDPTLAAAKKRNDDAVRAVQAAARAHGVADKDMQSDYLSIDPRYRDAYERKEPTSYVARRSMVVTLRDVARFDELYGAVVEAGGNTIQGVDFRTSELRKHRDEARAMAIKAAEEKARALAAALGQSILRPLAIDEEYSGWSSSYGWWGGYGGGQMAQNVMQNAGPAQGGGSDGTLAPGRISVSARVRVRFELK